MWFKKAIYILFAAFILASCNESKSTGPNSTGRGSEIIVVCNKPVGHLPPAFILLLKNVVVEKRAFFFFVLACFFYHKDSQRKKEAQRDLTPV